jgi:hypothetical protein
MTDPRPDHGLKPVSEFTEEDLAEYDFHLEVPFFYATRQRLKAWRKRRALAKHAADGDALAAGEIAEGDGSV